MIAPPPSPVSAPTKPATTDTVKTTPENSRTVIYAAAISAECVISYARRLPFPVPTPNLRPHSGPRREVQRPITCSTVNPNCLKFSSPGADAPKWSIPIIKPSSPVHRCQPKRRSGFHGNALLERLWKNQLPVGFGLRFEQVPTRHTHYACRHPRAFKLSWARMQRETSEPVPIRITSGFPLSGSERMYAPFATPGSRAPSAVEMRDGLAG